MICHKKRSQAKETISMHVWRYLCIHLRSYRHLWRKNILIHQLDYQQIVHRERIQKWKQKQFQFLSYETIMHRLICFFFSLWNIKHTHHENYDKSYFLKSQKIKTKQKKMEPNICEKWKHKVMTLGEYFSKIYLNTKCVQKVFRLSPYLPR